MLSHKILNTTQSLVNISLIQIEKINKIILFYELLLFDLI